MKALIELVKSLHIDGIISLDLSADNIRFTEKSFLLRLVSMGNSFDLKSCYDIDRNFKVESLSATMYHPPEVILNDSVNLDWHCDIWSIGVIISLMFSDKIFEISSESLISFYETNRMPSAFYDSIQNVYIKSIVIGILRINRDERPNIFEVIDVFNDYVKTLDYNKDCLIAYTKDDLNGINVLTI
jgi:serine/threonine protein kinase